MWIDREMPVNVIARLGIVGAPAIRPDLRVSQGALSCPQDDAQRLVIDDEWQTGHGSSFWQDGCHAGYMCNVFNDNQLLNNAEWPSGHSDTFDCVSE